MKYILLIFAFLFSVTVNAEDGLSIQFTIEENELESKSVQTYTNSILMKFNESVKFEFDKIYNVKFTSRTNREDTNLVITLHDWIDDKPYYIGAKSIDIAVGSTADIKLKKYGREYKINIETSYGKLP